MFAFQTHTKDGIFFIKFPKIVADNKIEELRGLIKQWQVQQEKEYIFDFEFLTEIQQSCYQPLIAFARELKKYEKTLYTINVGASFLKELKKTGLESTFNVLKNFNEVVAKKELLTKSKYKIDIEFIGPFVKAAIDTLSIQANTKVEPCKPYYKKDDNAHVSVDIVGVINITSVQFKGTISIAFPKAVFLSVYEGMVGEKATEINKDTQDACGEILNIIFGAGKAVLNNEKGFEIQKAIPTVLSGEKVKIQQKTDFPVVVLPFKTMSGEFYIEITAEPD